MSPKYNVAPQEIWSLLCVLLTTYPLMHQLNISSVLIFISLEDSAACAQKHLLNREQLYTKLTHTHTHTHTHFVVSAFRMGALGFYGKVPIVLNTGML